VALAACAKVEIGARARAMNSNNVLNVILFLFLIYREPVRSLPGH
jgi:hypothetical protein